MRFTPLLLIAMTLFGLAGWSATPSLAAEPQTLVLSAPQADDSYYEAVYDQIIAFQMAYALAIAEHDNVVILVDEQAHGLFGRRLPETMLLRRPLWDIWARDFTPAFPAAPVRFRYAAAAQGGSQSTADGVQRHFLDQLSDLALSFGETPYILDGGNLVDDGRGKAVVTDRFLEDNDLTVEEARAVLRELLGAEQVAIVPSDDEEGLGHADGMVMFGDPETLFVNRYEEPFRGEVLETLEVAFPEVEIVELPVAWDDEPFDPRFGSACGIYVNSVVTDRAIYVPQFGGPLDQEVLAIIRDHTDKAVVPVAAQGVCKMGGSARCLVWQQAGANAKKLLQAARQE